MRLYKLLAVAVVAVGVLAGCGKSDSNDNYYPQSAPLAEQSGGVQATTEQIATPEPALSSGEIEEARPQSAGQVSNPTDAIVGAWGTYPNINIGGQYFNYNDDGGEFWTYDENGQAVTGVDRTSPFFGQELTFYKDGSVTALRNKMEQSGTYEVNGETITIKLTDSWGTTVTKCDFLFLDDRQLLFRNHDNPSGYALFTKSDN